MQCICQGVVECNALLFLALELILVSQNTDGFTGGGGGRSCPPPRAIFQVLCDVKVGVQRSLALASGSGSVYRV